MVFINGGAFDVGASSRAVFIWGRASRPKGLAMVVVINYRLGALGFLSGGTGPDAIVPNLGLQDQQLAMRWVHDNAAVFGGDPERITLFGESAGPMSIGAHLASPSSAPLFRGAIMESNPYGIPFKNPDQAQAVRTLFDNTSVVQGCPATEPPGTIACLKALTWQQVLAAQDEVSTADLVFSGAMTGLLAWAPVVDGTLVPVQPNEAQITKPVIAGTNLDEGTLFVPFTSPLSPSTYQLYLSRIFPAEYSQILALPRYAPIPVDNRPQIANIVTDYLFVCPNRHVLAASTGPAYAYKFARRPSFAVWPGAATGCQPKADGGEGRVCHSFELPYVFRNAIAVTPPPRRPVACRPETVSPPPSVL